MAYFRNRRMPISYSNFFIQDDIFIYYKKFPDATDAAV